MWSDVMYLKCVAVLQRVAEFLPVMAEAEEKLQTLLQVWLFKVVILEENLQAAEFDEFLIGIDN